MRVADLFDPNNRDKVAAMTQKLLYICREHALRFVLTQPDPTASSASGGQATKFALHIGRAGKQ